MVKISKHHQLSTLNGMTVPVQRCVIFKYCKFPLIADVFSSSQTKWVWHFKWFDKNSQVIWWWKWSSMIRTSIRPISLKMELNVTIQSGSHLFCAWNVLKVQLPYRFGFLYGKDWNLLLMKHLQFSEAWATIGQCHYWHSMLRNQMQSSSAHPHILEHTCSTFWS